MMFNNTHTFIIEVHIKSACSTDATTYIIYIANKIMQLNLTEILYKCGMI